MVLAVGALTLSRARLSTQTVSTFTFLFYLYFIVDYFLRFPARIPGYSSLRPTLIGILILSTLLFVQREKFKGRFDDPVFRGFFLLVGYIILTLPLVEWPGSVIRGNWETFLKAVVFLFFTALTIDTEKRLKWFVAVFVFCQIFRVLEPLYLNITQGYWGSATHLQGAEFANRLSGAPADVINPNELGFVIATVIPFLHYLLWPKGWFSKGVYLVLIPLLLYALILTMSRGGFIALLVVAFFVFKESRRKAGLIALGVIVVVCAFSVMTPIQKDRYLSLIDRDTAGGASAEGRIRGMVNEFKLGLSRPIVGHGLGTTPEAKTHKLGSQQASHNLYAEVLIELGIVGFIIFIMFLVKIAKKLKSVRAKMTNIVSGSGNYFLRLNKVLLCVFWMYVVYSINYWGLSQYYWYLFAGLVIAFGRLIPSVDEIERSEGLNGQDAVNHRYRLASSLQNRHPREARAWKSLNENQERC